MLMEWLIPILVLIGVVVSLVGNINERRYAGRQGDMPPASFPKMSEYSGAKAPVVEQKAETAGADVQRAEVKVGQTEILHQQKAGNMALESHKGMNGGLKLRLRGRGLTRAMAMMEVLGPPKARRYMP